MKENLMYDGFATIVTMDQSDTYTINNKKISLVPVRELLQS
ncbi:MAG: hypothetical protein QM610_14050 [Chitinophagaceae bacterium]